MKSPRRSWKFHHKSLRLALSNEFMSAEAFRHSVWLCSEILEVSLDAMWDSLVNPRKEQFLCKQ